MKWKISSNGTESLTSLYRRSSVSLRTSCIFNTFRLRCAAKSGWRKKDRFNLFTDKECNKANNVVFGLLQRKNTNYLLSLKQINQSSIEKLHCCFLFVSVALIKSTKFSEQIDRRGMIGRIFNCSCLIGEMFMAIQIIKKNNIIIKFIIYKH